MQSVNNPSALICKVCQTPYQVEEKGHAWSQIGIAVTPWHWVQTAGLIFIMCGSIAGASVVIKLFTDSGIRLLAVGGALLVVYVCCRFLGLNTLLAYQRAKVSAFKIASTRTGGRSLASHESTDLATVTQDVLPPALETSKPDIDPSNRPISHSLPTLRTSTL